MMKYLVCLIISKRTVRFINSCSMFHHFFSAFDLTLKVHFEKKLKILKFLKCLFPCFPTFVFFSISIEGKQITRRYKTFSSAADSTVDADNLTLEVLRYFKMKVIFVLATLVVLALGDVRVFNKVETIAS